MDIKRIENEFSRISVGDSFALEAGHDFGAVRNTVGEWARRNRCCAHTEQRDDGTIVVTLADIARGSPLRRRKAKPWHDLAVGGSCVVPAIEAGNGKSLRCYVSIYGTKAGQYLSVEKVDGGFKVTRRA